MNYIVLITRSLLLLALLASTSFAASVSVNGTSPAFSVDGTGMDGVYGVQIDIRYDTTSVSSPTVTKGGLAAGTIFAENHSTPGLIKIAAISNSPLSSSGQIASITFASKTGSGGITSVNYTMINNSGSTVATSPDSTTSDSTFTATAGIPFSSTTTQTTQGTQQATTTVPASTATSTAISSGTYPGSITLPTDPMQQQQQQPSKPAPITPPPATPGSDESPAVRTAEQGKPAATPAADTKPEETQQYIVYLSVSERFQQYGGSKKLSVMATLFNKKVSQTISQEPPILLSDGRSKAVLTIDIPARITLSPNFAVNGGTLVSFKQDQQNKLRWNVEVLPAAGTGKMTVTILAGAEEFEYPLTVAPPVKTVLSLDELGWNTFLKEVGTAEAPLHDLNKDGVRDYLDEFIFVANYLVKKTEPVQPVPPPVKPASAPVKPAP